MNRSQQFVAALAAEPWLRPYVDDADERIDDVRRRFDAEQRVLLRRLLRDGADLHRRFTKPGGLFTTALDEKAVGR